MEDSLLSDSNKAKLQGLSGERLADGSVLPPSSSWSLLELVHYLSLPQEDKLDDQDSSLLIESITQHLLPPQDLDNTQELALEAELAVACLYLLSSVRGLSFDASACLPLVFYTDVSDPWTTPKAADSAVNVLGVQLTGDKLEAFIIDTILQGSLKRVFMKLSTKVTDSGRPSHYPAPTNQQRQLSQSPAWKQEAPWAISALRWAVQASETHVIQDHWPLFTPALLALAEDEDSNVRSRGLDILALFISKCPGRILQTTGLASIFEQVAFPALLHLPGITPEVESVQLLDPAYRVLLNLVDSCRDPKDPHRRRLLDKILRDGIFEGYHHASQHVLVARTLLQYMASAVNSLGIYSVKHLQKLLSMLSVTMTDPFALASAPVVLAAAKALNALIARCWPRFLDSANTEQVIRIISLSWLSLRDGETATGLSQDDAKAISQELTQSANMLQSIWRQHRMPPPQGLAEALKQEPHLVPLFVPVPSRVIQDPV